MRKNQVSIKVERFGDQVPLEVNSTHQVISAYADSNVFSTALLEAIRLLMEKIEETPNEPDISSSVDVANLGSTNQSAVSPEMLDRKLSGMKSALKHEIDDIESYILYAENLSEISRIVVESADQEEAISTICARFDVMEYRAKRILSLPLLHANKNDIATKKKQLIEMRERLDIITAQLDAIQEIGMIADC